MKPAHAWAVGGCGLMLLMFLACSGMMFLIEGSFRLVFGWIRFLSDVGPRIRVAPAGIGLSLATFALFCLGLHLLLVRLARTHWQHQWRLRWTLFCSLGVVLLFGAGTSLVGIVHQSGWLLTSPEPLIGSRWEAARRSQSRGQFKQIGLAMHNYHDTDGSLPPGGTFDEAGQGMHSWTTHLLPYLDQTPLARKIDLSRPWTAPENREHFRQRLTFLESPGLRGSRAEQEFGVIDYAMNSHLAEINRGVPLSSITDGISHTILAGEVKEGARPWGDPVNWRDPSLGLNRSPHGFGSHWKGGGVNVLFADGAVRTLSPKIDANVLHALSTPRGGEALNENDF